MNSDPGRDCEFRCIRICASNPSNAFRRVECTSRVRAQQFNIAEYQKELVWLTGSSWRNSAVLGTYFLKEELGVLGKLGCAICLIGSVIIVLHAPPDKEITTIDEVLNYAIQPGMIIPDLFHSSATSKLPPFVQYTYLTSLVPMDRLPAVLPAGNHLLISNDLRRLAEIRQKEPAHLYLHLRHCWVIDRHELQGIRDCGQVDVCGWESVYAS